MNTNCYHRQAYFRRWAAAASCVALFGGFPDLEVQAQLAITEVMASASLDSLNQERPDFWELTNFGPDPIDLRGYRWGDDADILEFELGQPLPVPDAIEALIGPGKSVIFVRKRTWLPNAEAFKEWWGGNLPDGLQVFLWGSSSGGLNGDGDGAVRLWDPDGNLVDEAKVGSARRGITFTYNTNSGAFTEHSEDGVAGAFRAAQGGDVGSPGIASSGPVALRITPQTTSQTVDAGTELIFSVQATGRPTPRYQWYFNRTPIQKAKESGDSVPRMVCFAGCGPRWRRSHGPAEFVLTNVQPENAGEYFVEVFNGLEKHTDTLITLTVNSNPSPIQAECPPNDTCEPRDDTSFSASLVVTPGQAAILTVQTRGFPPPSFQWSRSADGFNFTDLPGQTNRDLVINNAQVPDAGLYRVRLQNLVGTTDASASLIVKSPARLDITEAMSAACGGRSRDWWELTNTGDESVNLCGYRWDDIPENIGSGPTINDAVILQPGESVILMESQTPESFMKWWGVSNLPTHLQFITYVGNGLSSGGDNLRVWNPNEIDRARAIASLSFPAALPGATFWFDPADCGNSEFGVSSRPGDCGSFIAAEGCDVGSPGWTRWTPPQLSSVRRAGSNVTLSWRAQPGSTNRMQFTRNLAVPASATVWTDLGAYCFPDASCIATDSTAGEDSQRFYRVVRIAPANCLCPDLQEFVLP